LAISSGTSFYSNEAFLYDESTGEIKAREDYPGASLLFDPPLDAAKADHEKAKAYLEKLLNRSSSQESREKERAGAEELELEWVKWLNDLRAKIRDGEPKEVTIRKNECLANGDLCYTF
jgi:hypothetical protein